MRIRLTVVTGNKEGETFYIGEGEQLTIGRDESADLQLIDPGVSRVHASIRLSEERPAVTDLGSSNGTLVNGNRITTVELEDGDMIQTGAVRLLVTLEEVGEEGEDADLAADELVVELDRSPFDFSQVQVRKRYDTEHEGLFMSGHGKLLDQYKIAHKSLETLYRISNLVHQEEDINRLFEAIMDAVFNVFKADRILLIMKDRDFGSVEPVVFRKRGDAAESRISISHTIVSEVLDNGISLLTFDAQKDERFKAGESVVMGGIRSVMCVPVRTGKEILGVVYLDTISHPGEFSENDLELLSAIGKQAGVAIRRARLLDDLVEGYYSTVRTLVAAVEAKDSYTRGHSERVTAYAMTLGQILGLAEEKLDILRLSSLLHDIGKIAVPESVLNKPGKLTEDEWLVIRRHPEVGATIVRNIKGQDIDIIAAVIRHHHERFDGRGYPDGLTGEDIPLLARVLAVADSYDAMTSRRSYRGSLSKQQVVTELSQGKGTQFDNQAASAMLELVESGQVAPIEGNDTTVTL